MNISIKVNILSYKSSRTPKKASKRRITKINKSKSISKFKAKINVKADKRQRDNIGSGVDEKKKKK
jgi:hypothetical protein